VEYAKRFLLAAGLQKLLGVKKSRLLVFSSICTYLCFLGLILSAKNPICIDSKVVERLDIVLATGANSENQQSKYQSIYSCQDKVQMSYNQEALELAQAISPRINSITNTLESIRPFEKKLRITIRKDNPLKFEIKNSQLQIGTSLLRAEGHFERGLIKLWIDEKKSAKKVQTQLSDEVWADFLFYAIKGSLAMEDPLTGIQTRIGLSQWPQVLKNTDTYCDSAWKLSEHFESCGLFQSFDADSLYRVTATLSLRPLLSTALIKSYKGLNFANKNKVISQIDYFLSRRQYPSEKVIESLLLESNPLKQGVLSIKNFSDFFVTAEVMEQREFKQLYSGLTYELQNMGVTDSFAEAYFDYLIEFPIEISSQSKLFKDLEKAAFKKLNLQVAIKDKNKIWILPSKTALPLSAFDGIKARQIIFFACSSLKEFKIEQFINKSEKLMLIKGCDQSVDYHFAGLFESGVKEFLRQNTELKFVQFHLPSLEMKQLELSHVSNFFQLVEKRDVNSPEFRTLGWSQIQWSDEYHAYKPKAIIDAIEYFRN